MELVLEEGDSSSSGSAGAVCVCVCVCVCACMWYSRYNSSKHIPLYTRRSHLVLSEVASNSGGLLLFSYVSHTCTHMYTYTY